MAEKQIIVDRDTFLRFNAAALQACFFLFKKYGLDDKPHQDEYWDKTCEIYSEPSFKLDENLNGYFEDSKRESEIMEVE